jgi:hypothetical protein
LSRPGPKRFLVADREFFWLVRRIDIRFVRLRIWSATKTIRPLEVRIRCDDLWVNYPHLLLAPERAAQVLEFRVVTPGVVRQVLEDAIGFGWSETSDRSPLKFDWDRDAEPGLKVQPWRSLPDFKVQTGAG